MINKGTFSTWLSLLRLGHFSRLFCLMLTMTTYLAAVWCSQYTSDSALIPASLWWLISMWVDLASRLPLTGGTFTLITQQVMLVLFAVTHLRFTICYQHSRLCIHLETNRTFWVATFTDLNGFSYHDNWLHNLLIASSMNGRKTLQNGWPTKSVRTRFLLICFQSEELGLRFLGCS